VGRFRPYVLLASVLALNALAWGVSLAFAPSGLPLRHIVAQFFSTSAIVLMSTNVILATRPFVLDRIFGGLDKLYISHRANGIAVALLVASHFALMPESPGWRPTKITALMNISLVLISVALAIAPRSPWRKLVPLRYQHWKFEHRFMGVFLAFGVLHSLSVHPLVLILPVERTWLYTVATLGLLAYAYRELAERFVKERHRYRVAETHRPTDNVIELTLAPVASHIAHRAGQFAFVRFPSGPSAEQHPFTLSAAPSTDGHLRFSIKASGDYTAALQTHIETGAAARIEGPYGGFEFRRGKPRQLWLAGGIGITPYLAFLGDAQMDRDVHLIWSIGTRAEAFCLPEIESALAEHPQVRFELWVTSENGRLDLADAGLERCGELSVFLCGPVAMREAYIEQLIELGVARREIHFEEFRLR
jgi:predicted ferric reductase